MGVADMIPPRHQIEETEIDIQMTLRGELARNIQEVADKIAVDPAELLADLIEHIVNRYQLERYIEVELQCAMDNEVFPDTFEKWASLNGYGKAPPLKE